MNRIFKILFIILASALFIYVGQFLFKIVFNSHAPSWEYYKSYMWIFKDSIKKEIDTSFCVSYVKQDDVYNDFRYAKNYNIIVWEFKNKKDIELEDVAISSATSLSNYSITSGQLLNKDSDVEIDIKFRSSFNDKLNILIDKYGQIIDSISSERYKGFYGYIKNMVLTNEKDQAQIIFDYSKGKTQSLLLIYKKERSLFLIIINSDKPFDKKFINIFNLN